MPGMIRKDKQAMKLVYKIMKTPKDKRQNNQKKPSAKLVREWFIDSCLSQ